MRVHGVWKYVCDDSFSNNGANVACRELGFESGSFSSGARVPQDLFYDDVSCTGFESSLAHCSRSYSENCGISEGVTLKCGPPASTCRVQIKPSGASSVHLDFSHIQFNNTADTIKVYNKLNNGTLIYQVSYYNGRRAMLRTSQGGWQYGSFMMGMDNVTSYTGEMLVVYQTTESYHNNAFTATYTGGEETCVCMPVHACVLKRSLCLGHNNHDWSFGLQEKTRGCRHLHRLHNRSFGNNKADVPTPSRPRACAAGLHSISEPVATQQCVTLMRLVSLLHLIHPGALSSMAKRT